MSTLAQGRTILRGAWSVARSQIAATLILFAAAGAFALNVWPYDREILAGLHDLCGDADPLARRIAWYLGTWGDYPTYNLPFTLFVWIFGAVTGNRTLRRIALVAFLGASLAGLGADFFRLTLGRARPDSHMPDGFYGIAYAMRGGFQSFPSGHAAADLGMGVALLAVSRPLGILTTLFALAVTWARLELERHFPSDVIGGATLGIYAGLLIGLGANQHERSRLT